jgi:multiple sugar transport system permease protein
MMIVEDVGNTSKTSNQISAIRRRGNKQRQLIWYVFLLPYLIAMLMFSLGPTIYAVLLSFAKFEMGIPQFFAAGFDNFVEAYTHFKFLESFANIARYTLFAVTSGLVGVLVVALLLDVRQDRVTGILRTLYFLPGSLSGVGAVLLFTFVLDPELSVFGSMMRLLGPDLRSIVQAKNLFILFTLLSFYLGAGTWIAIFIGALGGVSHEVLDAATVDGCNAWQKALYIKLPSLRPLIGYFVILAFAGNVQIYTEPAVAGGVWGAPASYWAPNQVAVWFAFDRGNFGAASALSLLMMVIGLVCAYLVITKTGLYDIERN